MSKSAKLAFLFDGSGPRLFSIDAGRPFLADLADGLIDALGRDLPRAEIFFPTRRAVRAASESFLDAYERSGVFAALLPKFRAIGDIDEDELIAFAGDAADEAALPPAISRTERMVALARLVAARDKVFAGQENWPAAIAAARELGKLLDSFYSEEIDPAALGALDVADSAGHWARALDFLEIVTKAWPDYLSSAGKSDPSDRRAKLINAMARRLGSTPPDHPLIIAGTTASAPAVARLVDAIALAPQGAAVLPGLDRTMDARTSENIDDAHPQSGMKALLESLKISPSAVRAWPKSGEATPRTKLLTLALRPADATDDWLSLVSDMTKEDVGLVDATRGMTLIEADNEEAEAGIIASLFRLTVEEPEKTAILVTPDRHLSRRVSLKMRRWNIVVDDSAGVPFANTPCGVFLRLVALFLEDPGDPVAILALLRHPLARLGLAGDARMRAIDTLDRALRGRRPAEGLASVGDVNEDVVAAIAALNAAASLFSRADDAPFSENFDAHIDAAESLAGADALWSGDEGEAGAELLAELKSAASDVTAIGGRRYSDVFTALIAGAAVRRRSNAHWRLSILGPLEARLQTADRIILGGLNEGVWPADAASDPFLSRKMREDLGLSSPERRIGLSAHDFAGLAAQSEVVLTRAKRAGGKPAKPSRWIIRLKNILNGAGAINAVDRSDHWRDAILGLDAAKTVKAVERPQPKAGPGRRPQEISVTQVERWLRDPYSIYALRLLGLKKLEDPGVAFGRRDMGTLLHKVFELAALEKEALSPVALKARFDELAPVYGLGGADRRFWSASIDEALAWFSEFDAARRLEGTIALAESKGRWELRDVDPPMTLTAVADRIDILNDGRAAIFDYKSGTLRTEKQDKTFSPQLSLTGAMVQAGAFEAIGAREVAQYAFIKSLGRSDDERKNGWRRDGAEAAETIRDAEARFRALIAAYDGPDAKYQSQPRPQFTDDYGDYDQLARRKEWAAAEDGDDGEGE